MSLIEINHVGLHVISFPDRLGGTQRSPKHGLNWKKKKEAESELSYSWISPPGAPPHPFQPSELLNSDINSDVSVLALNTITHGHREYLCLNGCMCPVNILNSALNQWLEKLSHAVMAQVLWLWVPSRLAFWGRIHYKLRNFLFVLLKPHYTSYLHWSHFLLTVLIRHQHWT